MKSHLAHGLKVYGKQDEGCGWINVLSVPCLATLQRNRFKGNVPRFTSHVQTSLTTNKVVTGCENLLQKVHSSLTWRGCVTVVQFILFNFANHSPSSAMELKVSKEITGKWQNQRSETNKYVSWALFLKLQAAGINFEKLLGWTVFKNPNFNPLQSSSVLPTCGICCFCYVIFTLL